MSKVGEEPDLSQLSVEELRKRRASLKRMVGTIGGSYINGTNHQRKELKPKLDALKERLKNVEELLGV